MMNQTMYSRLLERFEKQEAELAKLREALERVKKLKPPYVRPSGGKDFHECHFIADNALKRQTEMGGMDVG